MNTKHNAIYYFLMAAVLSVTIVGSAYAGAATGKTNEQTSKNVETLEGVMSIKEGHGDFLIRLPDGKAQRFSIGLEQNADITRNGQPARYNELKVNDSLKVQYDGSTRKVIAIHAQGS